MWFLLLTISSVFGNCPNDFVYEENFNRCYQYEPEPLEFYLAEQRCQAAGASLVSISNGFENAMISEAAKHQFGSSQQFWIGANQLSTSNWTWIDESPLKFINWASGEPSSNRGKCAVVSRNGYWSAAECSTAAPFVCAVQAVTPTQKPAHSYCDSQWTYYAETDACYRVGHNKTFDDAELDCIENGAHLTSVHSSTENEFVNMLSSAGMIVPPLGSNFVWIGLRRRTNGFAWTDGTTVDYFNWKLGEPNDHLGREKCVETYADYLNQTDSTPFFHLWNDCTCDLIMRAYVCKKEASH